jgi:hypothetical protein
MAGSKRVSPAVAVILIVIAIIVILMVYRTTGRRVQRGDEAEGLPPFAQKGGTTPPIAQKSAGGLVVNPQALGGGATQPGGGAATQPAQGSGQ